MVFSSLLFLFVFLPAVLLLYYVSPWRIRNLLLFVASLVFYAWGEPVYIVLMLLSTVTDYFFGLMLERPAASVRSRKWIVAASIAVNLAVLGFFKYADFLIGNANALFGTAIPPADLPLPIGISFYTFQSMSYIIDIYRGTARAQRNWIDFATFVALFPQLVAGPIVHYASVARQLRGRTATTEKFAEGVRRFTIGLAKKVLLANNIGLLWNEISTGSAQTLPVLTAWIGIIAFAFQIYFDFSGYSDMAIGLGLMFGFRFNENFNKPYTAQSITDFWRRWHISLGSWFRDYLYIPLGGNRRGPFIQLRNIMIVWSLTGIWHGASWNFLLWGVYFGVILMLEKLFLLRMLARMPRWTRHVYALLLVLFGWVFFAFDHLPNVGAYFSAMFGADGRALWDEHSLYLLYTNTVLIVLLVLASLPWRSMMRNDTRVPQTGAAAAPQVSMHASQAEVPETTAGGHASQTGTTAPLDDVHASRTAMPTPLDNVSVSGSTGKAHPVVKGRNSRTMAGERTILTFMHRNPVFGLCWHAALLFMSIAYLVDATFNPFLYFRF